MRVQQLGLQALESLPFPLKDFEVFSSLLLTIPGLPPGAKVLVLGHRDDDGHRFTVAFQDEGLPAQSLFLDGQGRGTEAAKAVSGTVGP
jgi:hypothetical protein